MYDAIIIGAGIVGTSVARELSRYKIKTAVLEKGSDIASGATRGNSATVHSGHDADYGSLKAAYNIAGNSMFDRLSDELGFGFDRNGTIVFASDEEQMKEIYRLKKNGDRNRVPDLFVLDKRQLDQVQAGFSKDVIGALYAKSGGVVCPYSMAIALAENANKNGVEFFLETEVTDIQRKDGLYILHTPDTRFTSRIIFNCAGVYSDEMNNLVSHRNITITPRKGEHIILDKKLSGIITTTINQTPSILPTGGHTKGMGIIPSIDGTLILGCPAYDVDSKEDTTAEKRGLDEIISYFEKNWHLFPLAEGFASFPKKCIIGGYSGLRAHSSNDDFIIGEAPDAPGFFNAAGIESPGVTAAPAIARELVDRAKAKFQFKENQSFNGKNPYKKPFREMDYDERAAAFKRDPDYGKIVCRCETVTLAEIKGAIRSGIGAKTLDAVKMRTRAGMGRCQGGFCSSEVLFTLAEELGINPKEVTKRGRDSWILGYDFSEDDKEYGQN